MISCSVNDKIVFTSPINVTPAAATLPDQSEPVINSNEEILHIIQSSRSRASPSEVVQCHTKDTRWEWVLPLCRGVVGVFYNPNGQGDQYFLPAVKAYVFSLFLLNSILFEFLNDDINQNN